MRIREIWHISTLWINEKKRKRLTIRLILQQYPRHEKSFGSEAISKYGFWFKIKAGAQFKPQAYASRSRIQIAAPTPGLGQKIILRQALIGHPSAWPFKGGKPQYTSSYLLFINI